MSSTTLLLVVTSGVFCSTSLIGAAMILFLWLQANRAAVPQPQVSSRTAGPRPHSTAYTPAPLTAAPRILPAVVPPLATSPPDPTPTGPRFWLDGIGGMISGQRIMLDGPQLLVGRSGVCNIQFHDPKISRQHAILRLIDGQYQIEDMRSMGGTYVNDKPITVHRLRDRDQIRLGDSVLVFRQQ
jgi:hypothetical protein